MKALRVPTHRSLTAVAFSVFVCLAVSVAASFTFFEIVELNGFDRLVAEGGAPPAAERIVFVDISDATVESVGQWPIPRRLIARAVQALARGGPDLIGLDVLLSEKRSPDEDAALAAAVAEAGNVVLAASRNEDGVVAEPLPPFRDAALDVAAVNLYPDRDGAIRRVPLVVRVPGFERVGFAAALATNAIGAPLTPVGSTLFRIGDVRVRSEVAAPGDPPSALVGAWKAPGQRLDLLRLLDPAFDPAVVKGRIVIVGESSKAGKDLFTTPLYGSRGLVSGPEIHAAALAALLDGRTVRALPGMWLVNLAAALLALLFMMHGRLTWAVPAVVGLGVGVFGAALWLLVRHDIWLEFISTELALMLSFAAGLGYRFLRESEQERELRKLFGQYVSSDVLQEVLRHPEGVIEGQDRTASVLFADIRGFTSTSAGQPPKEVIAWLNDYFEAMSEVIDRNGGFLNKFIGDGLMVVFGAPVSEGAQRDAERAVRTALQMLARLEGLNRENAARSARGLWRPPVHIGLGIHTGPVAAGNVGSPRRMEYSVIGETVNLAARLESATRKFAGVDLVISPATEQLVRARFVTEALGMAEAKGFDAQVEVYTVRAERDVPSGGVVA